MNNYRRHDAPAQDRSRELVSPWAITSIICAWLLVMLAFIVGGPLAVLATLGGLGIAITSAPRWTSNNFVERSESQWIVRRLERSHRKEADRANREAALIARHENPPTWEIVLVEVGSCCFIAAIAGLPVLYIANFFVSLPGAIEVVSYLLPIALLCWAPRFRRRVKLHQLGDEPRGGVKTVTLRDVALAVEKWPHRYPIFLLSSFVSLLAMVVMLAS